MPSEPRRLHGFTVVSGALRLARQFILPSLIGGASAGDDLATTLQWGVLILSIPSIVLAFLRWLAFRFRLDGDELIIDSGVLSRQRRVIPLARIQNVDLRQTAIERLAGVAELRMETASGGGDAEASLAVLSLQEARDLQADLMRRRAEVRAGRTAAAAATGPDELVAPHADSPSAAGPETGPQGGADPDVLSPRRRLLTLSIGDLAIAGATSNEAGLIAAGLATGIQLVDDLGALDRVAGWVEGIVAGSAGGAVGAALVVMVLALLLVVLGWVLSVGASVVRFYGFALSRQGDDIRREFGLLSRHHSTVPLERVQAVRIEETLLRRPFGLVALKVETAGARPGQGPGGEESEAFVPIARRAEVPALLREVFPEARFEGVSLNAVSPITMRRTFLRLAVPIVLASLTGALLLDTRVAGLLALLIPAALYARAEFRARAWARPGGFTLVRSGVLTRVTWVVPEEKVQTLHLSETPFQRRLGLRTLLVDTAAGGRVAGVVDLTRSTAEDLFTTLARDVEAARRRALKPALRETR